VLTCCDGPAMPKSLVVGPVNSFFSPLTPSQYAIKALPFVRAFGRVIAIVSYSFLNLHFFDLLPSVFALPVLTLFPLDIFMPPIGEASPRRLEERGAGLFSKSSGKLSISALTNPTAESKL